MAEGAQPGLDLIAFLETSRSTHPLGPGVDHEVVRKLLAHALDQSDPVLRRGLVLAIIGRFVFDDVEDPSVDVALGDPVG
jgi:hypothetical protein